jgi:uncharacterized protein (DUF2252 family)
MLAPRRSPAGTADERRAAGRRLRVAVPRSSQALVPAAGVRADPVALIEASNVGRVPELVPLRHARMSASAFAFFRGSAGLMAHDLALAPSTTLRAQLCGDCHLANFGIYATPERRLIFDLNDFDETAVGPVEWDVKRLATSAALAARTNRLRARQVRAVALAAASGYRTQMLLLAAEGPLATWYRNVPAEELVVGAHEVGQRTTAVIERTIAKARARTTAGALPRLTRLVDGHLRLVSDPPEITAPPEEVGAFVLRSLDSYRSSLAPEIRALVDRYDVLDIARKVVGVGSVGLRAWILLLEADGEPLLLQLKEARASVIEAHGGTGPQGNAGRRVVVGQRTMQAASDLFLGWLRTPDHEDYYVRQLRDMKGSIPIEALNAPALRAYAALCGAVLAHAHARSGDAIAIAGYVGDGTVFDEAIAGYALAYADLAERDFETFLGAIASGRLAAG